MNCPLCGEELYEHVEPDRDVNGRLAHWHCSFVAKAMGEWDSAPGSPWQTAPYEEGDDAREVFYWSDRTGRQD